MIIKNIYLWKIYSTKVNIITCNFLFNVQNILNSYFYFDFRIKLQLLRALMHILLISMTLLKRNIFTNVCNFSHSSFGLKVIQSKFQKTLGQGSRMEIPQYNKKKKATKLIINIYSELTQMIHTQITHLLLN